jgi:ubiquinone/menaquinone biosynthesis C-methylase UbiE
VSALNDPDLVAREYADESRFAVRAAAWARASGPDAVELLYEAVGEAGPARVLDVGCGPGEKADWVARALGAKVVALDQSERMVELTRARGIETVLGDVQALPFADGSFDVVIAAWMLYHVADLDLGLDEIARVLRPGGRLVASANSERMAEELRALVDAPFLGGSFSAENGEDVLLRHFARVERRDAVGTIVMSPAEARAYAEASISMRDRVDRLPELAEPISVTRAVAIFVAEKA